MLPISLIISLEIAKVCQSYFIMQDVLMHSAERDKFAKVSSTTIIEELGQINYIFSDKTGTLTRNIMEFKFLQVGHDLYGKAEALAAKSFHELKRQVTHTDTKSGIEYAFQSGELDALLNNPP